MRKTSQTIIVCTEQVMRCTRFCLQGKGPLDSPLFLFLNGESSLSPLSLRSNGLVHLGQGPVEGVKLSIKGCMGG